MIFHMAWFSVSWKRKIVNEDLVMSVRIGVGFSNGAKILGNEDFKSYLERGSDLKILIIE